MPATPFATDHGSPAALPLVCAVAGPTILFAVPESDRLVYSGTEFTRLFAHTTPEALALVARATPRLVVIDWDERGVDGVAVCHAAVRLPDTSVLVIMRDVGMASIAIKAGAQAILLKPFAPSLLAGRIGRTLRETESVAGDRQSGPTRTWPHVSCPSCQSGGAISFDFSSHRRMWLACLTCDHAWLGVRRE